MHNKKKEIIFGIGGGSLCYQLGIAKFIINQFDNNYLKNDFYYGGASAGSITALIMCSVLHGVHDIDTWFNKIIIKIIKQISNHNTGILFNMTTILKEHVHECYKIISTNNKYKSRKYKYFLNDKYHASLTQVPNMKKKIVKSSHINNEEDLVNILLSSCNAPLLSNVFCNKYKNKFYTDGIFCNKVPSRFIDSYKIYFTIINQKEINCNTINIHDWGTLSIVDLWFWGDINKCKKLYHQGYTDSIKNQHQIAKYIEAPINYHNEISFNLFYEKLLHNHNKKM